MVDNRLLDALHAVNTRLGDRVFVRNHQPKTHECEVSTTLNEWSNVSRSFICATDHEIAACACTVQQWEEAILAQRVRTEWTLLEEQRANNQQTRVSTVRHGDGAVTEQTT